MARIGGAGRIQQARRELGKAAAEMAMHLQISAAGSLFHSLSRTGLGMMDMKPIALPKSTSRASKKPQQEKPQPMNETRLMS